MTLLEGRPGAERSNLKFWLIQVPAITSPIASYVFSCGFHITVGLKLAPIMFGANFMLGSTFMYSLFQTGRPIFLGLNLFAVAMSLVLAQTLQRRLPA